MRTVERLALARATANGVPACPEPMTMAETTSRPADIVVMKRDKVRRRQIGVRAVMRSRIGQDKAELGLRVFPRGINVDQSQMECKVLTHRVAGFHITLALS